MSSAAMKLPCASSINAENFSANLEDGSTFIASLTELRESSTPGLGEVWVVLASDRSGSATKTFTIIISKEFNEAIAKITDSDDEVSLFYNDYTDLDNPTLQKARAGTIQYKLDPDEMTFVGNFNADIDKSDGSGQYLCRGHFDTTLSL